MVGACLSGIAPSPCSAGAAAPRSWRVVTSALDPANAEAVMALLSRLRHDRDLALLSATAAGEVK
jgi:hypothetical protein